MNQFQFDFKKLTVTLLIILIPLLSVQFGNSKNTPWFAKPFGYIVSILEYGYSNFSTSVRGTTSLYLNLIDINKKNKILVKENSQFKAQLTEFTELKLENQRLNKLVDFKNKTNMDLLTAKVIGTDLFKDHKTLKINRGVTNNLKRGMAVITSSGVVGYIHQAFEFTSNIILITDRYAAVDGLVQRTRVRGIIEGIKDDVCNLNYLRKKDDVKKGDLIVTSGLNNIFPKGLPISTVQKVSSEPYGLTQEVVTKPVVDINTLEEVFIVKNAQQYNFEKKPEIKGEEDTSKTIETPEVEQPKKTIKKKL